MQFSDIFEEWKKSDPKFIDDFNKYLSSIFNISIYDFSPPTVWQPDIQGNEGSNTRCVSSKPLLKTKLSSISSLSDLFHPIQKPASCSDLDYNDFTKLQFELKNACNMLASGLFDCPNRDTQNMGPEQVGCDGNRLYFWCNSDPRFKTR